MPRRAASAGADGCGRKLQSFQGFAWEGKARGALRGCPRILPGRVQWNEGHLKGAFPGAKGAVAPGSRAISLPGGQEGAPLQTRALGRPSRPPCIGAALSPLALWPHSPAGRSPRGLPRPPPSWSLFNDAPCGAFWDEAAPQPIAGRGGIRRERPRGGGEARSAVCVEAALCGRCGPPARLGRAAPLPMHGELQGRTSQCRRKAPNCAILRRVIPI